jgi:hypothetical protein
MKKVKLLLFTIILPVFLFSQGRGVEVVPFAGYMFGGSIKYMEGKLKVDNGMDFGASLLVPIHELMEAEINYSRMESKASFSPYAGYPGFDYKETNLTTNYIQIGAISKFYTQKTKAIPFGSFSLGASWFSPDDGSFQDVWRFSITAGLGVKVMFTERVGIMLRGRFMLPMVFGGVGMYIGSGGSGLSVNSLIAPFQGDLNGGLIFKLGGS